MFSERTNLSFTTEFYSFIEGFWEAVSRQGREKPMVIKRLWKGVTARKPQKVKLHSEVAFVSWPNSLWKCRNPENCFFYSNFKISWEVHTFYDLTEIWCGYMGHYRLNIQRSDRVSDGQFWSYLRFFETARRSVPFL